MRRNRTTTLSSRNSINRTRARLLAGCVLSFGLLAGGGEAMASCDISGSVSGFAAGLTTCTVTESGIYQVTVVGGEGGTFYQSSSAIGISENPATGYGGYGAEVTGEVSMTAGQVYDIITGISGANVVGSSSPVQAPSGGGASAIILVGGSSFTPYIVASGGGGGGAEYGTSGWDGGGGNGYSSVVGDAGGETVASSGSTSYGGGGGGLTSSGQSSSGGGVGGAGFSPPSGLMQGGTGGIATSSTTASGGGGGGYGGGYTGGGGFSYYNQSTVISGAITDGVYYSINSFQTANFPSYSGNNSQPYVDLALISTSEQGTTTGSGGTSSGGSTLGSSSSGTSVPEPSSLLVLAAGLGALFVARRGVGRTGEMS